MVLSTKKYIKDIAKRMGYSTGEYNGHFYIHKGEYRVFVVNAKEYSNPVHDASKNKEHHFEWVIKRATKDMKHWEEIYRTGKVYLTSELSVAISSDLTKIENIIDRDKKMNLNV